MKVIIIAAGRGKRMMPLTTTTPKPLLSYKGRPLIEWALSNLPDSENTTEKIDEIIVVIGYLGEQIRTHIGNTWLGRPVTYITQEKLNGTGGALLTCRTLLKGNEKFLVLFGDDIFEKSVLENLIAHERAILACQKAVERRVRTLEIDSNGNLTGIRESRPDEKLAIIFTGACVLTPDIFKQEFVPVPSAPEELSLPDTILAYAETNSITVVLTDKWISISEPKDLQ